MKTFTHAVVRSKIEQDGKSLIPNGILFAIYQTVLSKSGQDYAILLILFFIKLHSCQTDHVISNPHSFGKLVIIAWHTRVTTSEEHKGKSD